MLALIFPGQGSQRPGMGGPWRDHPSWVLVSRLSEVCGRDLDALLIDADADTLRATRNAQIATFVLSLVILDAARQEGLAAAPTAAVAGHSLGEYSALVAAGVISAEDGARLVTERGEAMQSAADAAPGTMAAVLGLDFDTVVQACTGVDGAWVANDNAPGQVVISGTAEGIERAGANARDLGAKRVLPLAVGGAFHSPLMAPAQVRLETALRSATFADAAVPIVTNVDADAHRDGAGSAERLRAQLCAPVRWRDSLVRLHTLGATTFVELGPGTELSGMVKRTVADASRANVATPDDLAGLAAVTATG